MSSKDIPQETAQQEAAEKIDEVIHVDLEDEEVKGVDKQEGKLDKKGKKSSAVWEFFKELEGCPAGFEKAKCKLCNVVIGCNTNRNGTSAMMNHLRAVCPKSPLRNNLDKMQKTLKFETLSKDDKFHTLKAHTFDQEKLRKNIALMCIKDNQPFRIVEHEGFLMEDRDKGGIGKSELDVYLVDEREIKSEGFDILLWWKTHSTRLPVLSDLAKHVLGMPVSSVTSEAAFSTGGRTIDVYRSSLSPKTAESLVCSQDWLRTSENITDLRGESEEYLQFEKLKDVNLQMSSKLEIYSKSWTSMTKGCLVNLKGLA